MSFTSLTTDTDLKKWIDKLHIPLVFIGFKDQIPHTPKPGAYIINLASSTDSSGGTHWTGFYLASDKSTYYFDSFGAPPPDEALALMKQWTRNANHIYINPFDIQSISGGYCGQYVIDFLAHIMRNPTVKGFKHFLNQYKLFRVQNIKDTNI